MLRHGVFHFKEKFWGKYKGTAKASVNQPVKQHLRQCKAKHEKSGHVMVENPRTARGSKRTLRAVEELEAKRSSRLTGEG